MKFPKLFKKAAPLFIAAVTTFSVLPATTAFAAWDIIFFDLEGDGLTDHVGIVEKCENGVVYTV